MKLDDWFIQDALRARDWPAAIAAVCQRFGLLPLSPDDPAVRDAVISSRVYTSVPEQVRIVHRGTAYTWMAGTTRKWNEPPGETRIRIWTGVDP